MVARRQKRFKFNILIEREEKIFPPQTQRMRVHKWLETKRKKVFLTKHSVSVYKWLYIITHATGSVYRH